jgi:hypothetical protein
MLPDNNWYGHRYILLKYLNIKDKNIFASLQHGWRSQYLKSPFPKKKTFYPALKWSKDSSKEKNLKNYYIGSPFLYLCKLINDKKKKGNFFNKSQGTLVFPAHSSQDLKQTTNYNLLIKNVKKSFKGPYTVCFYYYDLNKNNISLFLKKGWRVICCVKNKTDKYSLYRLHKEINKHQNIVCGEFNTALFYSMYLKKKTKVLLNSNERFLKYDKEEKNLIKKYKNNYPELFKKFLSPEKGRILAEKELGYKFMKSRKELARLLKAKSLILSLVSKIFAYAYDLKYGFGIRKGKDLSKKNLKKYINKAA